ncbi:MAG: hypothetical protein NVSMB6_11530 [Burkholderiaceae bacterium]
MPIKSFIAAAAILLSAGSAFAEAIDGVAPDASYKSTLSRARVVEQLRQAQARGEIQSGELYGSQVPNFHSTKSRAQVIGELKQAQANGEIVLGELYGEQPATVVSTRTRRAVHAEAVAFAKNHGGAFASENYAGS